ncbi:hypothetical protein CRE_19203 [Caenorhabditis remanei]|uniref:Uncharacterized protein n=1 Tax=Caenorhabditis remanei TaxID=31234 RepID=E3MJE3_CAERE|nr:hypothetical protein CRE_19203 [Caenorhabditis remanei]
MEIPNATDSLITFATLSNPQLLVHIFAIIFPASFFAFDIILLLSAISSRKDASIPVAYIVIMCLRGLVSNFILTMQYCVFLLTTSKGYEGMFQKIDIFKKFNSDFLALVGKETTLFGTFSYLTALVLNVLMSLNRLAVVLKPFNEWFSHSLVFFYYSVIGIILFVSLAIPYFSSCYVMFIVNKQAFVSGCAPARHPITTFQNTYTIVLPVTCMIVNLGIILHLRFVRNNSYKILWHTLRGSMFSTVSNRSNNILDVISRNVSQTSTFSKMRARRDVVMIRQTISIAVYLSIYEFGAFIIKVFPGLYIGLSQTGKEAYFYARMESVPLMNFCIT